MRKLFTSESVTEGHPDKMCDQISDAILDAILEKDEDARVACECVVSTGIVFVTGEITTDVYVDIPEIVRETVRNIGYDRAKYGFDAETCGVITSINTQSPDIAMGVDLALEAKQNANNADAEGYEIAGTPEKTGAPQGESAGGEDENLGAGDQGLMFGYACDETPELMPLAISLSHRLARRLAEVRKNGTLDYLRPDGKTQVTVEYVDDEAVGVKAIVVSAQHSEEVSQEQIRKDIMKHVIEPIVPAEKREGATYFINPTGRFVIGGPKGDSGLTGRKIIVDTYGGFARHGGGAFSGKDPTKVDRSAAYMARYIAKNIVAAGIARRCEVSLAYAIGVAKPVSVGIDTFGTGKIADEEISNIVQEEFDLRPTAIIKTLDLRKPRYRALAAYGHFGREDVDAPWEKTDRVDALKEKSGL